MDDDIDLNGIELFAEDINDAENDVDDAEIDLNDINMNDNRQYNHDQTATISGNLEANTSHATSTITRKRGRTKLNKTRTSKDLQIGVNQNTKRPKGELEARYSTWVGLEAKTRFSILGTDWRKFDKADKDRMWMAIKLHWHLSDDTLKEATLKIASTAWRNFKKNLKACYMEQNKNPCEEYNYIDPKTWQEFCEMKSTPEFQALSETNRAHAKENNNPHHLGSRGYEGKYDLWEKEEEQGITPEIFSVMHECSRHWIL